MLCVVLCFGAWALGLGPWPFGLGPWALGPVPWVLGLGPWVLGLGPWTLALGLGSWALGEGRAGSIPEIRDFFSRRRAAAPQCRRSNGDAWERCAAGGREGCAGEHPGNSGLFFGGAIYTHVYIYSIIG